MNGGEVSGDKLQRAYRIRIAFFLVCVMAVVAVLATTCQGVRSLMQLNVVERERDQWQRSSDILQSLNVGLGKVVADLGCGSGYFTLKLSSIVGPSGRVLAIDIRRTPLFFLWLRAILRHYRNVIVIHGRPDNPKLPAGGVDAVLIVNTYHELANPEAILHCTYESLRPGGRLVVVDRGADFGQGESRSTETRHHELDLDVAVKEIRQSGFEIITQQEHFIDHPGDEPWWLTIAQRP